MAPASAAFALSLIFSLDSSRVSALAPGLRVPPLPLGTINASALEQRHRTIIGVVLGTKKRRTWGNFTTNHNFLLAELPSVKNWRIDLLTVSSRTSLCCRKCQLLPNINATHFFRSPLFKRKSPVVLPRTHDHHFSTSLTLLPRRHSMRPLPLWYLVSIAPQSIPGTTVSRVPPVLHSSQTHFLATDASCESPSPPISCLSPSLGAGKVPRAPHHRESHSAAHVPGTQAQPPSGYNLFIFNLHCSALIIGVPQPSNAGDIVPSVPRGLALVPRHVVRTIPQTFLSSAGFASPSLS